jgi:hypothetical protein
MISSFVVLHEIKRVKKGAAESSLNLGPSHVAPETSVKSELSPQIEIRGEMNFCDSLVAELHLVSAFPVLCL